MRALSDYKAVITAGGIGTRLLPFSKEIPKEMFPIFSPSENGSMSLKPLAQAIFEQLYAVGLRNFYFVVGRGKRAIEDHFSPDPRFLRYLESKGKLPSSLSEFYEKLRSSNLVFLNQPEPLGFGDAVLMGRSVIDGDFMVLAGDTLVLSNGNCHFPRLAKAHERFEASATILLQKIPNPTQYGVVEGTETEEGILRIKHVVEKPEIPRSNWAIMPVYIFKSDIFEALSKTAPGKNGELQLTDAIQKLVEMGESVIGVELKTDELRLDLGTPETIIEALKLSMNGGDTKLKLEPADPFENKSFTSPIQVEDLEASELTPLVSSPRKKDP